LVLGIPRSDMIVADIVAKKLNADFDILIPRKPRAQDNEENAIGAVMERLLFVFAFMHETRTT
jgi:predicted phosphoribosyltransferase